jgi:hypothetical protein
MLTTEFTPAEALQVVRAMNKCSAPGPDGFGPSFYGATWSKVAPQVMDFLHSFQGRTVDLE